MSDVIRFSGVTVNAPDAIALARFYAEITGGVARGGPGWAPVLPLDVGRAAAVRVPRDGHQHPPPHR